VAIVAPTTDTTGAPTELDRPPSPDQNRRAELSAFLKSRRARIKPDDVGLPPGTRRRTPGLRREEVAQLAGVGITWYTWLEQGRDINVSAQVVDAIARTLRLDRFEWAHLSTLAGLTPSPSPAQCAALTPPVRHILEQLDPYPACVINDRFDLLAFNQGYSTMMQGLDELPPEDRNVMWLAFTSERYRSCVGDIDEQSERLVAGFRASMANHLGERSWIELLERLRSASPRFAELWERHDVAPLGHRTKVVSNPDLGLLRFTSTNLWVSQASSLRMVVYTPLDDDTESALRRPAAH
jgi:transcriptional regulator with XRE-family HTH domain